MDDSSFASDYSTGSRHRLRPIKESILPSSLLSTSLNEPILVDDDDSVDVRETGSVNQHGYDNKTHWLAYSVFFLLGVGMLLPWNVFITCREYFSYRLVGSTFADNFDHFFANGFTLANVLTLVYLHFIQGKPVKRMLIALVVNSCVFLCCVLLTFFSGVNAYVFFSINCAMVVLCGISTGFLQNGVFGLVSLFPTIYMQAVMSGQGLAGAAVAISQIVSKLISRGSQHDSSKNVSLSTFLYFSFALLTIIFCFVGAISLQFLDIYRHYTSNDSADSDTSTPAPKVIERSAVSTQKVLSRIFPMAFAVFFVFFLTLSLFPPIISIIESVNHDSTNIFYSEFFNPSSFLTFALFDWLGKSMPGFPAIRIPKTRITIDFSKPSRALSVLGLALARVAFIPLFLLCNIVLRDQETFNPLPKSIPTLISSDVMYFIILAIFSVSNGWLASLAMMHGPQMLSKSNGYRRLSDDRDDATVSQEKQVAGTLMVFTLTLGLACGSVFSFLWRSAICGWCNPFLH